MSTLTSIIAVSLGMLERRATSQPAAGESLDLNRENFFSSSVDDEVQLAKCLSTDGPSLQDSRHFANRFKKL